MHICEAKRKSNLIFEHSNLSSSNKRFVQDGLASVLSINSSLRLDIVDSSEYRVVIASLLSLT